jgi:tRNA U34 5-carboxymethylaminomethyl modifying GTPase MnmE/TrmE
MKNVLLVGITGSGKSTLANILLNKNGNFEEVFDSSGSSVSTTKEKQIEEFEENGNKYRIIDTVGINDTGNSSEEVSKKILEACQEAKNITQIFFIFKGKFTETEREVYNSLKSINNDITKYITIIRTNYVGFENEEKCEKDKKLLNENPQIATIINSCNKVIYVDNPPLSRSATTNKEIREKSRQKLLNHLETCQETYDLTNLTELDFATKEEKLKRKIEEQKKKIEELNDIQNGLEEKPKNSQAGNNGYGGAIIITIIFMLAGVFYYLIRSYL